MSMKAIIYLAPALWIMACQPKDKDTPPDPSQPEPIDATHAPQLSENLSGLPDLTDLDSRNGVIYQSFHWYSRGGGDLWARLAKDLANLKKAGMTALWLPPAYKGAAGAQDVGYGAYDLYDLGEFNQKGSVRTKYGTQSQYLQLIREAQASGLAVYADVVMNHKMGADATESAPAIEVDRNNRNQDLLPTLTIQAWTKFDYAARSGKYSDFKWDWSHFTGVDWDQSRQVPDKVYRFQAPGKKWRADVSSELGNYDYLMAADIDYGNQNAVQEMINWGKWYTGLTQLNGFRIDAAKHISSDFLMLWLDEMRANTGRPLFAVAEYLDYSLPKLLGFLNAVNATQNRLSLFDMPLHLNFHRAGLAQGSFDMRRLTAGTLVEASPKHAVTFVDSHDTQPLQSLESPVADWFKPLAYAFILLRAEAYPAVFAADYEGANYQGMNRAGQQSTVAIPSLKANLDLLLRARHQYAYGSQRSYLDHPDIIGWTRSGDDTNKSGLAVLMSDGVAGSKKMAVGKEFAGTCFQNFEDPNATCVMIDAEGMGEFFVAAKAFAIWVGNRI